MIELVWPSISASMAAKPEAGSCERRINILLTLPYRALAILGFPGSLTRPPMPFFVHRIFTYSPSKPRHPLLRLVLGLLGVVVLAVLVVVGLFVGLGMLAFAAVRRMLQAPAQGAPRVDSVIDGEYSVVDKRPAAITLQSAPQ